MSVIPEEDDRILSPIEATQFRRVIARGNYLCQDRMDIQYAVKEVARGMATPRQSHLDKLIRLVKYLVGKMRYVIKYGRQDQVHAINCYGDSDFAGEVETRKSTSGGLMMLGDHPVKSWSSTQTVIALSTGEAELYAINKAAASGIGAQSILSDLGMNLDIVIYTDATSGKAMASRRGLGKVRHIAVNELWIQEHVQNKTLMIKKIRNKFNPADLMTKYLTRMEVQTIMEHAQNMFEAGRAKGAPQLAKGEDQVNVICRGSYPKFQDVDVRP